MFRYKELKVHWSVWVAGLIALLLLIGACTKNTDGQSNEGVSTAPLSEDRLVQPFKVLMPAPGYYPTVHDAGLLLVEELKALGFRPEIVTFPSFSAYTELLSKTPDWGLGLAGFSFREDRLDPDEVLKFFTCDEMKEGGRNEPGYCNPEFDEVYDLQKRIVDPADRKPHVIKAQEILARDLPFQVQFHLNLLNVYNKERYENVVSIPGIGLWNSFNFVQATPTTEDRIFRVGLTTSMQALHPMAETFSGTDHDVIRLIYDTLTRVGPDGTPQPMAAEKWSQIDDATIDFTVRSGMTFHDGQPVTVDDIVFTYNYFLEHKPTFYLAYLRPIKEAERIDDQTIRLHLNFPYSPLLLTSLGRIPILPKHIWEGISNPIELNDVNLIGSGPYKYKAQSPGQFYELERFDSYYIPPESEGVLVIHYANRESEFLALAKGDIYFSEQKGITPEQALEIEQNPEQYAHLELVMQPGIDVRNIVFNMRENIPFHEFTLRKAVAHLQDFQTYVEILNQGMAEAGRGVVAPANEYWHNTDIPSAETDGVHYHQYDPGKARQILQEAGYEWDAQGRLYYPENYQPQPLP